MKKYILISGTVIKGLGIGKKMGFPTLNLNPLSAPEKMKHGIYAAIAETKSGIFPAAVHFGPRPAVNADISLEAYAIGLKTNLRGKKIALRIMRRLRAIKNFPSRRALAAAIKKDIAAVKYLKLKCVRQPAPEPGDT